MSNELGPHQRIRDYEIDRRLGGGGQAVTWLATDLRTNRRVVVKQLVLKTAETWKEIELFEREARTLKGLDHPSIPRFLDAFEERDAAGSVEFFLVQTWVDAPSLAEAMKAGKVFDLTGFSAIAFQLLDILSWLHVRLPPIIHRDLKPSNILLDSADRVHVIDFGAVKAQLSTPGGGESTIVGTHGYMPAEQLMGRASPQSDLYALGATLVHLASGHQPTTLPSDGLRLDIRAVVSLPSPVVRWLEALLAPEPRDRPASAAIAKAELVAALAIPANQGTKAPTKPNGMRNRALLALMGVLVGAGFWVLVALSLKSKTDVVEPVVADIPTATATARPEDPVFVAIPAEVTSDARVMVQARRVMLRRAEPGFPKSSLHVAFEIESKSDAPITELKLRLTLDRHGSDTRIRWDAVSETVPPLYPGEKRIVTATFHDMPSRIDRIRVEVHRVSNDDAPAAKGDPRPLEIKVEGEEEAASLMRAMSFEKSRTFTPTKRSERGRLFEDISARVESLGDLLYIQLKSHCVASDRTQTASLLTDDGLQVTLDDTSPGEAQWLHVGDRFAYRAICPIETTEIIWQIERLDAATPTP